MTEKSLTERLDAIGRDLIETKNRQQLMREYLRQFIVELKAKAKMSDINAKTKIDMKIKAIQAII